MRRNRKTKRKLFITLVMLSILSIGLGYAILTETLTISNSVAISEMKWDVGFSSVSDNGGTILSESTISTDKKSITVTCDFGLSTSEETCIVKATITNNSTFDIMLSDTPTITYDDTYISSATITWIKNTSSPVALDGIGLGTSEDIEIVITKKEFSVDLLPAEDLSVPITITMNWVEADGTENIVGLAVLKATTQDDTTAFRSATYKSKIKTLTFEDEINVPETATESWDLGVNQNGNVMAYVIPNTTDSTYYDLYIQSDTQLYANRDMSYWFAALTYVDEINNLELLDTSKTTNMLGMFSETGQNSTVFTLDVSNFDTSSVINMSGMFFKTGNASTVFTLDVSNFDTSSVIDMGYMFTSVGENNPNFTLDVSGFDTTNVTNMYGMFWYTGRNSTIFTLDVSNFDTSNVTNMGSMFAYAGKNSTLFTLDVSNFDTSNVTNMGSMFSNTGYTNPNFTLDVSNFDTSNVTNMGSMFKDTGYNSTVLQLDVSGFDTSNVTSMNYMFDNTGYNSTVLQLDVSKFNTSKVTSMVSMFSNTGYTNPNFTLDVSKFDTSNVTRMENMFSNTGYNSTKLNTTITIRKVITNPRYYSNIFNGVATKEGSKITVNYTSETSDLVDLMVATKIDGANVVKGVQVD